MSLYVKTTNDGSRVKRDTRLERVPITANLRLDAIGDQFAQDAAPGEPEWTDELRALWRLAQKLEQARGKNDVTRTDYSFHVDWNAAPDGKVSHVPRPRGFPLDKLVAELMIHVNERLGA